MEIEKAHAALDVNVGSFYDPEAITGIAHPVQTLLLKSTSFPSAEILLRTHATSVESMCIPGFFGISSQASIEALPDTGAKCNSMNESGAKKLRFSITQEITCSIAVTRVKTVRTVGVVVAPFTFQSRTSSCSIYFLGGSAPTFTGLLIGRVRQSLRDIGA